MMAVKEGEFAELRADVKHLKEEFEEFRDEVLKSLRDGSVKFKEQELRLAAEQAKSKERRYLVNLGIAAAVSLGGFGAWLVSWVPIVSEWLSKR